MIDHTSVNCSDFARSKAFYERALAPIGYGLLMDIPAEQNDGVPAAGFGEGGKPDFWIGQGNPGSPPAHVAFTVRTHAQVKGFYAAALAAGGRDNGAPGLREHYHPNYYAAFVRDPDGHNIEAVCHRDESASKKP